MATTKGTDPTRRPERVAARVQRELADIFAREISDPRLQGLVISDVRVTDDLSLARVVYAMLGDDPNGARAKAAGVRLKQLATVLRAKLAPRLGMRRVPVVEFRVDANRAESERLESLLHEVSQELKAPRAEDAASDDAGAAGDDAAGDTGDGAAGDAKKD